MKVIDYHEAIFASELTSNARLTALAISKYYNWKEKEACWPSNNTLAKATGLSVRSIVRSKNELVNSGYLVSHRQYNNACLYIPSVPQSTSSRQTDASLLTDWQLNNEVNNEYNNEKNNEYNNKNVSNETLVSSININIEPEDINEIEMLQLETNQEPPSYTRPAAAQIMEEDWLSW